MFRRRTIISTACTSAPVTATATATAPVTITHNSVRGTSPLDNLLSNHPFPQFRIPFSFFCPSLFLHLTNHCRHFLPNVSPVKAAVSSRFRFLATNTSHCDDEDCYEGSCDDEWHRIIVSGRHSILFYCVCTVQCTGQVD